tara:strand:- start:386 stop:562 length:177 start_codon:yes stop_codon:yes gene_type:complete
MPMTSADPLMEAKARARTVKTIKMALDILSSKCKTKVTTQTWVVKWECLWGAQWIIMA